MKLTKHTYGKDRVRVMRIHRDGDRHEVRELTVHAMLTGDFSRIFTHADNSSAISTDTVKNVINVVARENLALATEPFCSAVARRFLESYPQVASVSIHALETKWVRLLVGGNPHAHSFLLDSNGKNSVCLEATRQSEAITSGVAGFTFMKTTNSGWDKYEKDKYTTILETRDRMCATSLDASWRWSKPPNDYTNANAKIMSTMLDVFASTYSESVQDSLFRMASAALSAVPEVIDISLAAPNKHYLLINLDPFKLGNNNQVFLPTDEPHGQIECTVGRG
jgi:urate oxidase